MKRLLVLMLLVAVVLTAPAHGAEPFTVEAKGAVLIDADSGRILFGQNENEMLPMASTTKIMTALLALEMGDMSETITVGKNAYGVPGTSMYLELGEEMTLEQMLYGLMLASGNDAAVAIAEHLGGTVENFCRLMTRRAEEIGCENTIFSTPHGLPAQQHHTTAWDLALITREALKLPAFREIVSTQRASLPWAGHAYNRVLTNKNRLLSSYPGAIGVKTGYTRAAGRCLVFAAEREGMLLLGVLLNCPNWFEEAEMLLDQGFRDWQMVTLLEDGEIIREIPVENGTEKSVRVRAAGNLAAPMKTDAWPDLMLELPASLPAGVEKGQKIGTASLRDGGEILASIPLYAEGSVPEKTFRDGLARLLGVWPLASGK